MLHEILLCLSGHPSGLFDSPDDDSCVISTASRLLSPPEAELLASIGHLSRLHRRTRDHVSRISTSHPSTVCRAVANAIKSYHLHNFQRKVLEVEGQILKHDSSIVGAYNIVPLASVVNEFSEWVRVMEWLWNISNFMMPVENTSKDNLTNGKSTTGAGLVDRLRREVQTGYADIEEAARHLGKVAETSWLRQLSTWLLYGRLPPFGASDFFIQQQGGDEAEYIFTLHNQLAPKFVTRQTAASILFIGKSLNQIRSLPSSAKLKGTSTAFSELELLPKHLAYLSQVTAPVLSAKLSGMVADIRLSLSQNLLQHLLPREKIVETLTILHQFFLLGRGEFAVTLIAEADDKLSSRYRAPLTSKFTQSVKGVVLRETEINQILARSFSILSTLSSQDDHTDDILDVAAQLLHLSVQSASSNRPGTPGRAKDEDSSLPKLPNMTFNELLLAVPSSLTMDIQTPLDLFLSKADLDVYSSVHASLLAVRRAHLHLAQLWRHSSIRRDHPCPPGYQYSNSAHGKKLLQRRRERTATRARDTRKVWATCAAAIFYLAESEAYFQGAVVQQSFHHFLVWVTGPQGISPAISRPTSSGQLNFHDTHESTANHDPEGLALAHRRFLSSVVHALLLTDMPFTKALRTFCMHVDELVALITRLTTVQQNLDLEEDEGIEDYAQNYKKEEKEVNLELDRARKRLDADLKALVERLREIDSERVGTSIPGLANGVERENGAFEPLRVGGIDRLLMKLDWGGEDEEEGVEDWL